VGETISQFCLGEGVGADHPLDPSAGGGQERTAAAMSQNDQSGSSSLALNCTKRQNLAGVVHRNSGERLTYLLENRLKLKLDWLLLEFQIREFK